MGKKIFYPMHTVTNVQLLSNGDIITSAVRKEVSIQLEPQPEDHSTPEGLAKINQFKVVVHNETSV